MLRSVTTRNGRSSKVMLALGPKISSARRLNSSLPPPLVMTMTGMSDHAGCCESASSSTGNSEATSASCAIRMESADFAAATRQVDETGAGIRRDAGVTQSGHRQQAILSRGGENEDDGAEIIASFHRPAAGSRRWLDSQQFRCSAQNPAEISQRRADGNSTLLDVQLADGVLVVPVRFFTTEIALCTAPFASK